MATVFEKMKNGPLKIEDIVSESLTFAIAQLYVYMEMLKLLDRDVEAEIIRSVRDDITFARNALD